METYKKLKCTLKYLKQIIDNVLEDCEFMKLKKIYSKTQNYDDFKKIITYYYDLIHEKINMLGYGSGGGADPDGNSSTGTLGFCQIMAI